MAGRVSNPGLLALESDALPNALRGSAYSDSATYESNSVIFLFRNGSTITK